MIINIKAFSIMTIRIRDFSIKAMNIMTLSTIMPSITFENAIQHKIALQVVMLMVENKTILLYDVVLSTFIMNFYMFSVYVK